MDTDTFLSEARTTYVEANARSLRWLLGRPRLRGVFLNTKQNSITLRDYDERDDWRSPQYLYGWIQGRGLEALVLHAAFFSREDPALAAELVAAARPLYGALRNLRAADGHAYFCYDAAIMPVIPEGDQAVPQLRPHDLYTYSDAFVLKGLIAAAARHDPSAVQNLVEDLHRLVAAIEEGRFVMDERRPLDRGTLNAQKEEFGPRMIVLGAAALLRGLGLAEAAEFGSRFIAHVLSKHSDHAGAPASGLLRDTPGEDHCNPGHALEFVGFALEYLPSDADRTLVADLHKILLASFETGFRLPGVCLSVAASDRSHLSPYYPWWPLPEAIRAAALAYERTRDPAALAIWQQAHQAFFDLYWRGEPPLAYQTRTMAGPVDYVPATPDLDPAYHTGLSLLGAVEAIDRMKGRAAHR